MPSCAGLVTLLAIVRRQTRGRRPHVEVRLLHERLLLIFQGSKLLHLYQGCESGIIDTGSGYDFWDPTIFGSDPNHFRLVEYTYLLIDQKKNQQTDINFKGTF